MSLQNLGSRVSSNIEDLSKRLPSVTVTVTVVVASARPESTASVAVARARIMRQHRDTDLVIELTKCSVGWVEKFKRNAEDFRK